MQAASPASGALAAAPALALDPASVPVLPPPPDWPPAAVLLASGRAIGAPAASTQRCSLQATAPGACEQSARLWQGNQWLEPETCGLCASPHPYAAAPSSATTKLILVFMT